MVKIELKLDGLDELVRLIEDAQNQVETLMETIREIDSQRLSLQAKVNRPEAVTPDR